MSVTLIFQNFKRVFFSCPLFRCSLPQSSASRAFFPTSRELLEFFDFRLPQGLCHNARPSRANKLSMSDVFLPDLGGYLPPLARMDDPLHVLSQACPHLLRYSEQASSTRAAPATSPQSPRPGPASNDKRIPPSDLPRGVLSATSLLNPFFGYPVLFVGSSVAPEYGRRRKRDLVYTLTQLLWARWKSHVKIFLVFLFVVSNISMRKWFDRWLKTRTRRLENIIIR